MIKKLLQLRENDDGSTAVEYAVMLALIILACISSVALVGTTTSGMVGDSSSAIQTHFSHVE